MAESNRLAAVQQVITEICDRSFTPYVVVDTSHADYVGLPDERGYITLSIAANAVKHYEINEKGISFEMGVKGSPVYTYIPLDAILQIHPKEDPNMAVQFLPELTQEQAIMAQIEYHEECIKQLFRSLHSSGNPTQAVATDTSVNNGAPIGKAGWTPVIVK